MVVPFRELANTFFPTSTKDLLTNSTAQIPSNMDMNININIPRERLVSSSKNSLRESSTHSDTSSVPYYKRMETQSNNHLWNEQAKIKEISLLYTSNVKEENIPQINDNSPKKKAQHVCQNCKKT